MTSVPVRGGDGSREQASVEKDGPQSPFTPLENAAFVSLCLALGRPWRQKEKNPETLSCCYIEGPCVQLHQTAVKQWLAKCLMKTGYLAPSWDSVKSKALGCISWGGLSDHQGYPVTSLEVIGSGLGTNESKLLVTGPEICILTSTSDWLFRLKFFSFFF